MLRNRNVFNELAAKGHNLTILSPDIDEKPAPGIHYIWAEKVYSTLYSAFDLMEVTTEANSFESILTHYEWIYTSCQGFYQSKGFQTLLNYPDDFKFDLVLVDYTSEPCLVGFLKKFNYPVTVGMSAYSIPHYTYNFIGGHRQFSYVQHYEAQYDGNMNFVQRLHNFMLYMWDDW